MRNTIPIDPMFQIDTDTEGIPTLYGRCEAVNFTVRHLCGDLLAAAKAGETSLDEIARSIGSIGDTLEKTRDLLAKLAVKRPETHQTGVDRETEN